jgi:hypothetical protein
MKQLWWLALATLLSTAVGQAAALLTAAQEQQWRKQICDNFFVPGPLPALDARRQRCPLARLTTSNARCASLGNFPDRRRGGETAKNSAKAWLGFV